MILLRTRCALPPSPTYTHDSDTLILESLLRLVDLDDNGKQVCMATGEDEVSDAELEALPRALFDVEDSDSDSDSKQECEDSVVSPIGADTATAVYAHFGEQPPPSPPRRSVSVLDTESGRHLDLRAAAAACSEHAKQSSDRCIRVRQAKGKKQTRCE